MTTKTEISTKTKTPWADDSRLDGPPNCDRCGLVCEAGNSIYVGGHCDGYYHAACWNTMSETPGELKALAMSKPSGQKTEISPEAREAYKTLWKYFGLSSSFADSKQDKALQLIQQAIDKAKQPLEKEIKRLNDSITTIATDETYEGGVQYWIRKHDKLLTSQAELLAKYTEIQEENTRLREAMATEFIQSYLKSLLACENRQLKEAVRVKDEALNNAHRVHNALVSVTGYTCLPCQMPAYVEQIVQENTQLKQSLADDEIQKQRWHVKLTQQDKEIIALKEAIRAKDDALKKCDEWLDHYGVAQDFEELPNYHPVKKIIWDALANNPTASNSSQAQSQLLAPPPGRSGSPQS